jgi:hypothetical protein
MYSQYEIGIKVIQKPYLTPSSEPRARAGHEYSAGLHHQTHNTLFGGVIENTRLITNIIFVSRYSGASQKRSRQRLARRGGAGSW